MSDLISVIFFILILVFFASLCFIFVVLNAFKEKIWACFSFEEEEEKND